MPQQEVSLLADNGEHYPKGREVMTKKDLIAGVADMNDMNKSDVEETLNATLEMIQDSLAEGENVDLYGFGKFTVSERAARKGRNPATGESIDISARNAVSFKPAKALKEAVN